MNYEKKYLKYKSKYLKYKTQFAGNNRFTLIIKRRYINFCHDCYWYIYFIVDNLKPSNIYTYDKNRVSWVPRDNIVAHYYDQTMLKTTDGAYPGIEWPTEISKPVLTCSKDYENNDYRLKNIKKFGDKMLEIKKKKDNEEISFHSNYDELEINFD